MGNEKSILEVRTFGALSIRYQGKPLVLSKNMTGKMVHLLITLLYTRKSGVHREELLGSLYEDGDMMQASNSFRALLFRLRKNLVSAGLPEQDYILYEGNVYRWNSDAMEVHLDAEIFEHQIAQAADEVDYDRKLIHLEEAFDTYKGEFLPNMQADEWVLHVSHKLQKLYFKATRDLMAILQEKEDYRRLIGYCDQIVAMYPYEEWQLAKLECLISMKEYERAMQYYTDVSRMYQEEFNSKPPDSIRQKKRQIRRHIDEEIYSIGEIRGRFIEGEESEGAAYCDTTAFATIYRYLAQVVSRTDIPTSLMLITMVDHEMVPLQQPDILKAARDILTHVIRTSTRSSDLYTRFGRNQFLVLLIDCGVEQGDKAAARIIQNFSDSIVGKDVELCYTVDPVDATGPGII